MNTQYSVANDAKENFDSVYQSEDPRRYFAELGSHDYIIPHVAERVFSQIILARREKGDQELTVLDVGCSYGLNGALLKYPLHWDDLQARYTNTALQTLTSSQLLDLDKHFFASWPRRSNLRMIGIDTSANAIRYAERVGTIDEGYTLDLERQPLPRAIGVALGEVDLVISTGCIGYVTERTLGRLAEVTGKGRQAWYVSFVLRMFPFDDIAAALRTQGLETERLEGVTFVQRRFSSGDERRRTLKAIRDRGLDPQGIESEGFLHAELYVSRPAADAAARPLSQLVSIASGLNKSVRRTSGPTGRAAA